jgi:outer membrane immunogenic protein
LKHLFFGSVAALALVAAGPAAAADMPVKAPVYKAAPANVAVYNWTGFYVGGNVGYLDYRAEYDQPTVSAVSASRYVTWDSDGGVAGGTVGFNWQFASAWVIGVEGDWDWSNAKGSNNYAVGGTTMVGTNIKEVATLRGRAGFVWGSAFIFATGGGTWVRGDNFYEQIGNPADHLDLRFKKSGYNIGAGVEWPVTPNMSFKADALYHDVGRVSQPAINLPLGGGGFSASEWNLNFWTLRAGINWRFGDFGKGPVAGKGPVVTRY